jgi:hypothetical protein
LKRGYKRRNESNKGTRKETNAQEMRLVLKRRITKEMKYIKKGKAIPVTGREGP